MATWLAAGVVVALGGCSPDARVETAHVVPGEPATRCDANRVAHAVGMRPSPALLEEARAGAGAVQARTLAHDEAVDSVFQPERLNLVLDIAGRVGSVNCG